MILTAYAIATASQEQELTAIIPPGLMPTSNFCGFIRVKYKLKVHVEVVKGATGIASFPLEIGMRRVGMRSDGTLDGPVDPRRFTMIN